MKKILILCQHNTARSQMAEGYLNFFAGDQVLVQSAGIDAKIMHPLAVKVMKEDNIDITTQSPKLAKQLLKHKYDFLITFGEEIPVSFLKKIRSLRQLYLEIQDPILTEEDLEASFRETRETVKKFVLKFIGKELTQSISTSPLY